MGEHTSVEQQGNQLEKEAPFPLTDVDKWVLSQNDEDFHLHDWNELKEIIGWLKALLYLFLLPSQPASSSREQHSAFKSSSIHVI